MYDFDHAVIVDHGNCRPLVKERRIAVPAGVQVIQDSFPLTPWQCSIILAALASAIYAVQWKRKRVCRLWDILLMATITAIGIILFLMLFSQHPTVNLNLQFILLNPLPLFYLRSVIRQQPTRYWNITAILAVLFLIGAIFQQYAEGIIILALCLLLQCHIHYLARTKWIQQMKKQK